VATGRIGVTPTLRTRWSKQPTAGTTSLSGLDDNSVALVYDVGYEAVYRNGALLSRGNDYTATDGTTVTLIDATLAGDIIEILANQLVPLTDAISKGQFNAKGALLSATAASTPGVLAVGANDTVLTADSTTSTGLKWATPAAGGMTLLSTTTLSGTTTNITGINQGYTNLMIIINNVYLSAADQIRIEPNSVGGDSGGIVVRPTFTPSSDTDLRPSANLPTVSSAANSAMVLNYFDYANTTNAKCYDFWANTSSSNLFMMRGIFARTAAISSILFSTDDGTATFSGGTVRIYGVK